MAGRSNERSRYGTDRRHECFIKKQVIQSLFITFIVTFGVLIGGLYLSALIPKELFRDNLLESAYYLEENEDEFYTLKENNARTVTDNYADTITYNIMYSVNSEKPLESLIISPFYSDNVNPEYQMISILRERIEEEKEPDTMYDRYWHGMQMIYRVLFVFFTIKQIRIGMNILLSGLLFVLMISLWKKGQKIFPLSMGIAAVLVNYPMIGMCMEYVPTFFIMFIISFLCMKYYHDRNKVICLMLISGMCCGFFDILTTETVAVTIPLAIVMCLREKKEGMDNFGKEILFIVVSGFVWGLGYLAVFVGKWLFSSLCLGRNRFETAISMMVYRQGAQVALEDSSGMSQPMEALAKNIRLLVGFPLDMELRNVLMVLAAILGMIFCFVYVYRKTGKECILPAILGVLAVVPIARILILNSHSYQHSFFTYRALFASICCVITAVVRIIDVNLLKTKK